MKKVVVREAESKDLDQMINLLRELFEIEKDFKFTPSLQEKGLKTLLASESAFLLVAEMDGRVIAMATLQVLVSTAEGGEVGLIEDVVVDSDYRRRGIGEKLLEELKKIAESKSLSRLQLLADRENSAALAFYFSMDWKPTRLIALRK